MTNQKVWFQHYEKHVPEHIDYPDTVLPSFLAETARKYPHRSAIIFKGTDISYRSLDQTVDRLASALQKAGLVKGTRVAIHLPNCPQFIMAYFAVLRSGGIVVPCNPLYTAPEMKHQLNDSGAEIIFTLSNTYPLIERIQNETKLRKIIVCEIKTYFPPVLKLLFTLLLEKKKGHRVEYAGHPDTVGFLPFLSTGEDRPRPVKLESEDTAVLMYTGGTTGISKGAQLTHRNILVNAYQTKHWLNSPEAVDITLTQLPMFHCYGMTTCINLGVVNANTLVIIPDPRDIKDVIKTIHKYRPTLYPGVPAMYNAINNYTDLKKYDLSSIKVCVSGAAGLPAEVQQTFNRITGAHLIEGYGLSEASPVTHANPIYVGNRIGTIGLPWPDTDVRIMDVDTGTQILGPGEVGELCIRGPQVMKGYWNLPKETANALRIHPDGTGPWLHTGDIATMDEDGYFRIVDRKKDMILGAGGYNIYPREIEDVLYMHPKVLEAAVIGVPFAGMGERIKVFIVLKPGEQADEKEILDFCRENLAVYKVPKYVEFRDELPKTMVGKILRRELLQQELERDQEVQEKVLA